jgi:hypothetical protein
MFDKKYNKELFMVVDQKVDEILAAGSLEMSEITAENSFEEIWETVVFKSTELLEYDKDVKTTRTKIILLLQKHI